MKLFFTIVYKRIITLTMIIQDHPLVEYPLSFTIIDNNLENNEEKNDTKNSKEGNMKTFF